MKVDLVVSYKQICIRKNNWPFPGSLFRKDGKTFFCMDASFRIPKQHQDIYGLCDALAFIMRVNGVLDVDHCLDDFLTGGHHASDIRENN